MTSSKLFLPQTPIGNQPYVKAKGIDVAILNAVEAITYCLADTEKTCKDIPFSLD